MGQIQYIHNQLQAINLQYCLFWSSLWYFNEQLGEMKKIKNCLALALEVWSCEMELVNPYDKCLVAVKNQDGNLVSHAPKESSKFFQKFLNDSGEREAECIGNRLNTGKGKGVEIPMDYRLVANESYLGRLTMKLWTKDFADEININKSKSQRITGSLTR